MYNVCIHAHGHTDQTLRDTVSGDHRHKQMSRVLKSNAPYGFSRTIQHFEISNLGHTKKKKESVLARVEILHIFVA